jgi:hypothetical protein
MGFSIEPKYLPSRGFLQNRSHVHSPATGYSTKISDAYLRYDPGLKKVPVPLTHGFITGNWNMIKKAFLLFDHPKDTPGEFPLEEVQWAKNLIIELLRMDDVKSHVLPLGQVEFNFQASNGALRHQHGYGHDKAEYFRHNRDEIDFHWEKAHILDLETLWKVSFKNEYMKFTKIQLDDGRIFEIPDVTLLTYGFRLCQAFNKKLYTTWEHSPIKVGCSFQYGGLDRLVRNFSRGYDLFSSDDVRKFDKFFRKKLRMFCKEIRIELFDEIGMSKSEYVQRMDWLYEKCTNAACILPWFQVVMVEGMLSGDWNTTPDNSLAHLLVKLAYVKRNFPWARGWTDVNEIMNTALYSDDNLTAWVKDQMGFFMSSFEQQDNFYHLFGWSLKSEDHQVQDQVLGLTFLGAKIVEYAGMYAPQFDLSRIWSSIVHENKSKDSTNVVNNYQKLLSLLLLSTFNGVAQYTNIQTFLSWYVRDCERKYGRTWMHRQVAQDKIVTVQVGEWSIIDINTKYIPIIPGFQWSVAFWLGYETTLTQQCQIPLCLPSVLLPLVTEHVKVGSAHFLQGSDTEFKYHGNYCGPNYPPVKKDGSFPLDIPAVDPLDESCKLHDIDYYNNRDQTSSDIDFITRNIKNFDYSPKAILANFGFAGKILLDRVGIHVYDQMSQRKKKELVDSELQNNGQFLDFERKSTQQTSAKGGRPPQKNSQRPPPSKKANYGTPTQRRAVEQNVARAAKNLPVSTENVRRIVRTVMQDKLNEVRTSQQRGNNPKSRINRGIAKAENKNQPKITKKFSPYIKEPKGGWDVKPKFPTFKTKEGATRHGGVGRHPIRDVPLAKRHNAAKPYMEGSKTVFPVWGKLKLDDIILTSSSYPMITGQLLIVGPSGTGSGISFSPQDLLGTKLSVEASLYDCYRINHAIFTSHTAVATQYNGNTIMAVDPDPNDFVGSVTATADRLLEQSGSSGVFQTWEDSFASLVNPNNRTLFTDDSTDLRFSSPGVFYFCCNAPIPNSLIGTLCTVELHYDIELLVNTIDIQNDSAAANQFASIQGPQTQLGANVIFNSTCALSPLNTLLMFVVSNNILTVQGLKIGSLYKVLMCYTSWSFTGATTLSMAFNGGTTTGDFISATSTTSDFGIMIQEFTATALSCTITFTVSGMTGNQATSANSYIQVIQVPAGANLTRKKTLSQTLDKLNLDDQSSQQKIVDAEQRLKKLEDLLFDKFMKEHKIENATRFSEVDKQKEVEKQNVPGRTKTPPLRVKDFTPVDEDDIKTPVRSSSPRLTPKVVQRVYDEEFVNE